MELDWLTVAAQIVNFLVLVWLLQHFLYAPITKAMSHREERIEERLADARKSREEAEAEAARLHDKQEELERDKEALMDEARGGGGITHRSTATARWLRRPERAPIKSS